MNTTANQISGELFW